MTHLRAAYGLARGALVQAQVQAKGLNGWGLWSSLNAAGATVQTEPGPMNPASEGSLTSEAQIEVVWAALTTAAETGGAVITSYNLEWHAGGPDPLAAWLDLAGELSDYPGTSYITTTGIVAGATASFRLRAKNIWGWGALSTEAVVVASRAPAQPPAAVTSLNPSTGALLIDWTEPANHGSAMTSYLIEVRDRLGSSWNEAATCDGS